MNRPGLNRREWLTRILGGGAATLALRTLATGIPASLLFDPREATAENAALLSQTRSLIMSGSEGGCPLNANCPGSYVDPMVYHPPSARMTPTTISISGERHTAALPWSKLSQDTLDHMAFFHHGTATGAHTAFGDVMKLQNKVRSGEMMVSAFATHLQASIGTLQAAPVCVNGQAFSYNGAYQPVLQPTAIRDAILGGGNSALENLAALRHATMDKVHDLYKRNATVSQKRTLDMFVNTKAQAESISDEFLQLLAGVQTNNVIDQFRVALILCAMRVTPVVTLNVPFGGDNHFDNGFAEEIGQLEAGVASFEAGYALMKEFKANGSISNDVVFAWTSVFGRTLEKIADRDGRDHNGSHCVAVIMGDSVKGTVIGNTDTIMVNATTGQNSETGTVVRADLLASMGRTLGTVLGLSNEIIDTEIPHGTTFGYVARSV